MIPFLVFLRGPQGGAEISIFWASASGLNDLKHSWVNETICALHFIYDILTSTDKTE